MWSLVAELIATLPIVVRYLGGVAEVERQSLRIPTRKSSENDD